MEQPAAAKERKKYLKLDEQAWEQVKTFVEDFISKSGKSSQSNRTTNDNPRRNIRYNSSIHSNNTSSKLAGTILQKLVLLYRDENIF